MELIGSPLWRTMVLVMLVLVVAVNAAVAQEEAVVEIETTPVEPAAIDEEQELEAEIAQQVTEIVIQEPTILQERNDRVIATLPNRMIVIVQELPTAPVVSAQVWIKTGSIYEQEHVGAGLSHYLEHLLSGGTTSTRTEAESNAILGRIGARTNAATGLDNVRYYINTTTNDPENVTAAVDLLSDWMQNSLINETEYARERDVIQNEFNMGMGEPGRIFWKVTQKAMFGNHPAGHPTIGYIDEFLAVTRDEIYDFFRRMYVPNNMVFVVAGDVDKSVVLAQIAERWSSAETGELPEIRLPMDEAIAPPIDASDKAAIARPQLRLVWRGTQLGQEDDYELDLLAAVLGQGESSRLVRTLRDQMRLVTSIDAYNSSFPWGRGMFGVDCQLAQHDTPMEDVKAAILEQVRKISEEPVTEAELARAKRMILVSVIQQNQSSQGIASRLASDTIGMGDPDYLVKWADAIQSLTAADLRATAQKLLKADDAVAVTLLPLGEDEQVTIQGRPEDLEPFEDSQMRDIDLDNTTVIDALKESLAAAGSESASLQVDEPVLFTLENGLRLIVQRSTVVPAVAMEMYWLDGLLGDEPGREGVANSVATMMMRGTTTMTADQLNEAIEDLGANLATGSGNNTSFARASSLSEDWPTVMKLMADVVLQPSFPADEWAKLQPRLLAAIDAQRDTWAGELSLEFRDAYFGRHPWSQSPLGRSEVVGALTVEDLSAYHARRLNASDAVLAVVGDVNPVEVREQVEKLFGGMPAEAETPFSPPLPIQPRKSINQIVSDKPGAAVQFGFGPGMTRSSPDYPAMQVLTSLISDFPGGWIQAALRGEGAGLVYAVGGSNVVGVQPGYFTIRYNTSPPQVIESLTRTLEVVERARTEPMDPADIQRAKAKVLTNELLSRETNSERATLLALDELYSAGDTGLEQFIAAITAVDEAKLHEMAQKYLNNPVVVVTTHERLPQTDLAETLHGGLEVLGD